MLTEVISSDVYHIIGVDAPTVVPDAPTTQTLPPSSGLRVVSLHVDGSATPNPGACIVSWATGPDRVTTKALHGIHSNNYAEIAAVGGAGACVIDVRSLIRGAILAGAHAIILGHNHPSGDPTPSREDVAMTAAVQRACDAVGILLADHVIVCEHGENSSMLERGLLGGAS